MVREYYQLKNQKAKNKTKQCKSTVGKKFRKFFKNQFLESDEDNLSESTRLAHSIFFKIKLNQTNYL